MQKSKCTHIRVRDDNDYNLNIEALIESIQKEFNIDFRSLPEWQNLVKRLHVSQTDYRRRIQYAKLQKALIIDKLYMQSTRPSPFQLTDKLARTASKWQRMKSVTKIAKIDSSLAITTYVGEEYEEIAEEEIGTVHPNTENLASETTSVPEPSKVDVGVQPQPTTTQIIQPPVATHLPVMVCTNIHKLISPLDSKINQLSCHSVPDHKLLVGDSRTELEEWQPSTSAIICNPTPIKVKYNTLVEQSILFSLTNCTGQYLHVRFKYVTDHSPFMKAKILPKIPKRLYPGIPIVYKFIFQLKTEDEFNSGLYFKMGRDVYVNAATETFFVPIVSTFRLRRAVRVSDTITIPSVYPWHIKSERHSEYPTGFVRISVDDPFSYHLHIYKRHIDLASDSEAMISMRPSTLNSQSMEERESFIHSETGFPIASSIPTKPSLNYVFKAKSAVKNNVLPKRVESEIKETDASRDMSTIVDDIVELALEAFVFDCSYMYLHPYSKRTIPVYFTKAEHIGYHHSCYDFELIDPETEAVIFMKTVKVLTEVLPNPVQVTPLILDMSTSPILHGFYEDQFIITNTHKVYAITAHIKLTTKMKKLFIVLPMKSVVPPRSSVPFKVKFCSRDYSSTSAVDDLVHFTFKIVIVGYKMVFHHIPPIFYEIIVPCAPEFKKVYNEKYFKDTE